MPPSVLVAHGNGQVRRRRNAWTSLPQRARLRSGPRRAIQEDAPKDIVEQAEVMVASEARRNQWPGCPQLGPQLPDAARPESTDWARLQAFLRGP